MRIARPAAFWIVVCAVSFVMLVLLRQILLPFVVGALLAYLLVPAVDRLERFGINRSLAALGVLLPLIAGLIAFLLVMLPALIGEVRFFVDEFPRYITLATSIALTAVGASPSTAEAKVKGDRRPTRAFPRFSESAGIPKSPLL
jgi:predicted PurR-regulated permease PerM